MMRRRKRGLTVADLLHELPVVEVALALGVWVLSTAGRPGQVAPQGTALPGTPAVVV